MALVGEAHILVRAVTTKVKDDIKRAFNGVDTDANLVGEAIEKGVGKGSRAIGKFSKESEALAREFHRGIRNSYKFQAAISSLIQSVSALVNGLFAMIGNLAGAAESGVVLIGVMAQLKIATLVAKQAFSGIAQAVKATTGKSVDAFKNLREEVENLKFAMEAAALAEIEAGLNLEKARENLLAAQQLPPNSMARREAELAYRQADLAYRQAKDKAEDMGNEMDKLAKKDPFSELTKTQRQFAMYLRTVVPKLKDLKEAAASSFLPVLQQQIQKLISSGVFKVVVDGFAEVSKGLASASQSFIGTLFDPKNKQNLSELFKSTSQTTGMFGRILGNVFASFLTLMKAIDPLIKRFTAFLDKKSSGWADGLSKNFANVMEFFKDAGDAAAGWGHILGNLFKRFQLLIQANVGPGTGGQLLLDWMNKGTVGFKGLDGAAADFARKNYFLEASKNFIAIGQSIGSIFSFMKNLAMDPGIAQFWATLSQLDGPLNEIFIAMGSASQQLAEMIVAFVEVVASFADEGQLAAYMSVVTGLLKQIASMIEEIKPLLKIIGQVVGTFGGLIASMLILKKVMMLTWGTIMIFRKAWVAMIVVGKVYTAMQMAQIAVERQKNLAMAAGIPISAAQNKELAVSVARGYMSATAKSADAAGNVLLAESSTAAIPAVGGLAATINAAIWPLTLIVLALGAVALGIWAIVSAIDAHKKAKYDDAVKNITKSLKEHEKATLGVSTAQSAWDAAIANIDPNLKEHIKDIKNLNKNLKETETDWISVVVAAATGADDPAKYINMQTKAAEEAKLALDEYLTSISKLGSKSLKTLQRETRNLVLVGGLDKETTMDRILANKEYTDVLEKHAKAMGDTIKNTDGSINSQKALDYALAQGSYSVRLAAIARERFNKTLTNAIKSFIDVKGPLQQNIEDIKKYKDTVYNANKTVGFSFTKYKEDLKNQTEDLKNWMTNLRALSGNISGHLYRDLVSMGKDGMALVKSLVTTKNGIATVNQEAVKKYVESQSQLIKAQKDAGFLASALTDPQALINILSSSGKLASLGSFGAKTVNDLQSGALDIGLAANQFGVSFDALIAEARRLGTQKDLATGVNIEAAWKDGNIEELRDQLIDNLDNIKLTFKSDGKGNIVVDTDGMAQGGLVGSIKRFAPGGMVYGPGGPTSDRIPVMLSNGEYVINAAATKNNLGLLEAINSGASISGSPVTIIVNPSPQADEIEIAQEVSRRLAFSMRRGA